MFSSSLGRLWFSSWGVELLWWPALLLGLLSEEFTWAEGERDIPVGVLGRPSRDKGDEDRECLRRSSMLDNGFSSRMSEDGAKVGQTRGLEKKKEGSSKRTLPGLMRACSPPGPPAAAAAATAAIAAADEVGGSPGWPAKDNRPPDIEPGGKPGRPPRPGGRPPPPPGGGIPGGMPGIPPDAA